jgi:hypothetical protein
MEIQVKLHDETIEQVLNRFEEYVDIPEDVDRSALGDEIHEAICDSIEIYRDGDYVSP